FLGTRDSLGVRSQVETGMARGWVWRVWTQTCPECWPGFHSSVGQVATEQHVPEQPKRISSILPRARGKQRSVRLLTVAHHQVKRPGRDDHTHINPTINRAGGLILR